MVIKANRESSLEKGPTGRLIVSWIAVLVGSIRLVSNKKCLNQQVISSHLELRNPAHLGKIKNHLIPSQKRILKSIINDAKEDSEKTIFSVSEYLDHLKNHLTNHILRMITILAEIGATEEQKEIFQRHSKKCLF